MKTFFRNAIDKLEKNAFLRKYGLCVALCLFFSFLVGSFFVPLLVYVSFLVACIAVVLLEETFVFAFLLFVFPYGLLLKFNLGDGTSLFTYVEFFSVFVLVIKRQFRKELSFYPPFLISFALLLLFGVLGLLTGGQGSVKGMVKLFNIFMLLFLFCSGFSENKRDLFVRSFVFGLLLASVLGLFKTRIPRLLAFYGDDLNIVWISGAQIMRFSGVFTDPNYYSIPLILCIALLLKNLFVKEKSAGTVVRVLLVLLFAAFGVLTLSKSFFLVFLIVLIGVGASLPRKKMIVFLGSALVVLAAVAIIGAPYIKNLFYRFANDDLTTGRAEIWVHYIDFFDRNPFLVFFGVGISADPLYSRAIHNMYIESVFELGLIGSAFYLFSVFSAIESAGPLNRRLKPYSILGFLVIALMYFFLEGLTEFELPFYLMVGFMIFSDSAPQKERRTLKLTKMVI